MGRPRTIEDADLLRHARAVFLREGGAGSTREIARLAGVSEGALFRRYKTKAALFLAAMMPPEADMATILAPAQAAADPRLALTAIGGRMLDYFREAIPVMLHLMANPAIELQDIVTHFPVNPAAALIDGLADYLRDAMKAGLLTVDDPRAAAGLLVAAVHSLAQFEIFGAHGGNVPAAAIDQLVGALWEGLEPRGPGRSKVARTRARGAGPRARSKSR
jgi:AcrR family transcriptional regulator